MSRSPKTTRLRLLKWIASFTLILCSTSIRAQTYTDVTAAFGIAHTFGEDAFGGGLSFYDFNQDGWDDITLATQSGDSLAFYQNTGSGFETVYFAGIHHDGHVKQILWCDYDNDGDQDLYVSGRSSDNFIYINDGAFVFTPYLLPAPAPFFTGDTYGAAFGDFDTDGDLDLFICNRIASIPLSNQLYRNNGDGTMTDITTSYDFDTTYQLTFCASWIDYNNDLLPDLYTAEDRMGGINQLYTNQGDGLLEDDCDNCGAEIIVNAMSVSPGDYDNDGDLDIYISNTEQGNVLLKNNGDGTFTDVAPQAGVGYYQVAWGATFFDYDHDGDYDLYVSGSTNGTTMANQLYENEDLTYFSEAAAGFIGDSTRSFSHAIGDINNDGYYDIAVLNIDPDSSQLWQSSGGANNWVKIKLEGTLSNRDGIGSWIEVWTAGQRQVKYTTCGVGYLAQNSGSEIFGLGLNSQADSIIVKWTSGVVDKLYEVEPNQLVTIVEGATNATAVEEFEISGFSFYPNPTSDLVLIELDGIISDELTFDLSGPDGKRYSLQDRIEQNDQSVSVNLAGFTTGIYIITIRSTKQQQSFKVIKN